MYTNLHIEKLKDPFIIEREDPFKYENMRRVDGSCFFLSCMFGE